MSNALLVPNPHHPWHVDTLSAKGDCILHLCPAGISPDFDCFNLHADVIVSNALDALPTLLIRKTSSGTFLPLDWLIDTLIESASSVHTYGKSALW